MTVPPLDDLNVRKAGVRRLRPQRDAPEPRRPARRRFVATHYLPARVPGVRGGGRHEGDRRGLPRHPERRPGAGQRYMRGRSGVPEPPSTPRSGRNDKLLMVATNADPGRATRPRSRRRSSRSSASRSSSRSAPQDTLYTKYCNVPKARRRDLPQRQQSSRTSTTRSRCLDPVFNGRNILPANNSNWSELDDPAINAAMDRGRHGGPGGGRAQPRLGGDRPDGRGAGPGGPCHGPGTSSRLIASRDVRGGRQREQLELGPVGYTSLK